MSATGAISGGGHAGQGFAPGTCVGPLCLVLLCTALLCGCGGNDRRAPVEERSGSGHGATRIYTVRPGDTMYSIAFRYGMDYRRLGAANGLGPPYTIYPGQRIALREASLASTRSATARKAAPASTSGKSRSTAAKAGSGKSPSVSASPAPASSGSQVEPRWRWPTQGAVVRGYSSSVHKGIDIGGSRGDPVHAVAAGRVVYAGTGIVGFGELLIIKHNDVYLSAYGHNGRLLVEEGDAVKAGQRIALKGSSGTDKVKLHFEIRRRGQPVDPAKHLPVR
jgi:lipoprotein NlpD